VSRWRVFLEPANNEVDSYVAVNDQGSYAELKLADCTSTIELTFYTRSAKQRRTAHIKLARLQQALDLIADVIAQRSS